MEGLRGYAVGLVFFVHFFSVFALKQYGADLTMAEWNDLSDLPQRLCFYLFKSQFGVDLFFMLSGYLVFRLLRKPGFSIREFLRRRFDRIYPTFLVSLLFAVAISLCLSPATLSFTWRNLIGNLLFLNALPSSGVQAWNPVSWSLFYEFVFYLTFPSVLLLRRLGVMERPGRLAAVLLLAGVGIACLPGDYERAWHFLVGAWLGSMEPRLPDLARRLPDTLVAIIYLAITTTVSLAPMSLSAYSVLYGAASALLVIKACHGNGFLNRIFSLRLLRYLGNVSYSFYLVHGMCNLAAFAVAWRWVIRLPDAPLRAAAMAAISFAAAGVATVALFRLVERRYFFKKTADHPLAKAQENGR